jgi:hypothetical protein
MRAFYSACMFPCTSLFCTSSKHRPKTTYIFACLLGISLVELAYLNKVILLNQDKLTTFGFKQGVIFGEISTKQDRNDNNWLKNFKIQK